MDFKIESQGRAVGISALLGAFLKALLLRGGLSCSMGFSSSTSGWQETDLRVLAEPDCRRPWPLSPSGLRLSQDHILVGLPSSHS